MFTDKALQEVFCSAYDTAEQIWQPAAFADRLPHFVVYLGLLDFQNLGFLNPRYKCHICRSVPFLPCGIVGFNLCGFGIVLAYFLCRQVHAVFVKYLQVLFGVGNVAVDKFRVNFLYLPKKSLALEAVILYGKQMAFVNLSLFDNGTALSDLSVLTRDFLLGAYPFACFVKEKDRTYYEVYSLPRTEEIPEGYKEISFVCLRPDGAYESPSTVGIMCRTASKKVEGLEGFHFHQLRHTFTSNLLRGGAAPKDVQELLGHADVSTTMNIYAHATMEAKRTSARLLDKVVGGE